MKRKILDTLKVFCLFFFMIMGIFFVLVFLLHLLGMPLTDGYLSLVMGFSMLCEYGHYVWLREY